ncbi:MAG: hypothetical protein G5700_05475, partial [Serratia symbiotica]|nr:hypothetical protein [Serratia symbiotica]
MLNKSNFWPARGSDHSPSVKIATFRSQQKFNIANWKAYNNALTTRGLLTCW